MHFIKTEVGARSGISLLGVGAGDKQQTEELSMNGVPTVGVKHNS